MALLEPEIPTLEEIRAFTTPKDSEIVLETASWVIRQLFTFEGADKHTRHFDALESGLVWALAYGALGAALGIVIGLTIYFLATWVFSPYREFKEQKLEVTRLKNLINEKEDLNKLVSELEYFIMERNGKEPSPGDSLNYIHGVTDIDAKKINLGGRGNTVFGDNVDEFQAREARNRQAEKKLWYEETARLFDEKFRSRMVRALERLERKGISASDCRQNLANSLRGKYIYLDTYQEMARELRGCLGQIYEP